MPKKRPKLLLYIDDKTWDKFKDLVPRKKSLNDGVIDAIKYYIKKEGRKW